MASPAKTQTETKSIYDRELYARAVYSLPQIKGEARILKKYPSDLGTNCVKYASSKSKLPSGLSTLAQKKSHIKSNQPLPGKVGVTSEGLVGHLVIIEEVGDNTLIISEGNYWHGYVSYREIPKQNIIGYF